MWKIHPKFAGYMTGFGPWAVVCQPRRQRVSHPVHDSLPVFEDSTHASTPPNTVPYATPNRRLGFFIPPLSRSPDPSLLAALSEWVIYLKTWHSDSMKYSSSCLYSLNFGESHPFRVRMSIYKLFCYPSWLCFTWARSYSSVKSQLTHPQSGLLGLPRSLSFISISAPLLLCLFHRTSPSL